MVESLKNVAGRIGDSTHHTFFSDTFCPEMPLGSGSLRTALRRAAMENHGTAVSSGKKSSWGSDAEHSLTIELKMQKVDQKHI